MLTIPTGKPSWQGMTPPRRSHAPGSLCPISILLARPCRSTHRASAGEAAIGDPGIAFKTHAVVPLPIPGRLTTRPLSLLASDGYAAPLHPLGQELAVTWRNETFVP
jgi:hypothetical protein